MVLCCLRGVFACVSRTWLPLEHSLLLSEPCWGNGCLHSTWPVVCIFSGCCWCNLCVKIYIHPHPTWIYPLNSSKKVVQKRDDTNQNVDVLQSTPGIYVLNTFFFFSLSVSLSLYVWLSHGVWKERWSLFKFVVPGRHPFLFAKKAETWEWTPDPESSPTCWSDPLPVLQTVRLFSAPHCLHWAFVNQPTNPTNQPIQNIKKSHPSMCWNFRRQHVLRIAAKQFALGAVKVGTTESICFASRSIFVSLVMVDQDHFLLNQKSKRIEDGKVDWCSNLVSGNLWNPDDLCW